jgi:hypothetical protein
MPHLDRVWWSARRRLCHGRVISTQWAWVPDSIRKAPVASKRRGRWYIRGRDARQAASTALSAAGGRGHHYSALIGPHESNLRVVDTSPISKPQCSPKILPSISSSTESATTGKSRFARAFPQRPHRAGQLPRRPQVDGDDQALRPCERRAIWCGYRGVGCGG